MSFLRVSEQRAERVQAHALPSFFRSLSLQVSHFAQLTPQELLEETEKAVGKQGMLDKHQSLIEKRKIAKNKETVRGGGFTHSGKMVSSSCS